ncbi:hypothetical protein [Ornithinimicrobium pekingense]|uniref:Flp pilus-assembly TadG-like N-terminal domain-containing protein n=1 Tax=Ornithinimicrobium pekingense TaxID=384677 RepID=A0ABQ2FEQ5_9MICO|nr:hypothetical protein [Ornithinimicrobium pekingense]GGK80519.1 hypothetical protein GCM10011509_31280 [Ornithinimicrobium pekingense]
MDQQVRPGQQESGHVNLGLIFVSMIFTISVVLGIAGLAVATTSAQGNQNAADAAALAGAEAYDAAGLLYFAPGFSDAGELRGMVRTSGGCPGPVRAAAADYAGKNDATLESCRMLEWGEVEVTTRADVPLDGAADSRKAARAHWDLDLASCTIDPAFVAPATGAGYTWMQCGADRFDLKFAAERFFLHPWGQVKDAIEPKLTQ